MPRYYYVVPAEVVADPVYGQVMRPAVPLGVTNWVGTDDVGRGCFVIVSPEKAVAPTLGVDIQINQLAGLSDAEFKAMLPVEVNPGVAQAVLNGMTDAVGFNRMNVARLKAMSVLGL